MEDEKAELRLKKIDGKLYMGLDNRLVEVSEEGYSKIVYVFLKEMFKPKGDKKVTSLQLNNDFIITDTRGVKINE